MKACEAGDLALIALVRSGAAQIDAKNPEKVEHELDKRRALSNRILGKYNINIK
jgi:hypothetical protein